MAMPPRILLFSAIGIVLYLSLSLYHGHQLKKYPLLDRGGGKALSARAEEKTWVQVSTTRQIAAGPVKPEEVQEVPAGTTAETAAGPAEGSETPANLPAQREYAGPTAAGEDPQVLHAALEAELLQARSLLWNREEELRQTRLQLEKTLEEKEEALESANTLRQELTPASTDQEQQTMEIDRLKTELKKARARAAVAEREQERARLKAEAMFRYGQEQSRLLAPSRQEVEILKDSLREMSDQLHRAEQEIAELRNRERLARAAGREEATHGEQDGGKNRAMPAAERAD